MSKSKKNIVIKTSKIKAADQNLHKDGHQNGDELGESRKWPKNRPIKKLFCCHICGKEFFQQGNMKHHIRVHEGYRYICRIDMCYKLFTSKQSLVDHQLIHTGLRPYTCNVCGKAFRQSTNLRIHLRTHTGEKPYCCRECPKKFSQLSHLKHHMNIHLGVKPHICEICERAFPQSSNLKQHLIIHTGVKEFSCAHCTYTAGQKANLKCHLLSKCFQKHGFECQYLASSESISDSPAANIE